MSSRSSKPTPRPSRPRPSPRPRPRPSASHPPLAKPKPKPQPQAQPPPLPPPHPLAAKKSAKAAPEDEQPEELRRRLRGLSASLAAQKGAKAKAETKVAQWEAKLDALRGTGDEERVAMAEYSLRKARGKVEEKEEGIQQLDHSVRRMERIVAAEAKVKEEEVVDEVVELEVEAEEMVEETVKQELEEKVEVEKAVMGGQWLRVFLGTRDAVAIQDLPSGCHPHHPRNPPPRMSLSRWMTPPPRQPIPTSPTPKAFDAPAASENGESKPDFPGGARRGWSTFAGWGLGKTAGCHGVAWRKWGEMPPPPSKRG